MTEKFIVLNNGKQDNRGPVSFCIYKSIEKTDGMTVHNYKRQLRSAAINVNIPYACSKDLVKETGLTIEQLKNQPELTRLIGQRILVRMEEPKEVLVEVPLTDIDPDQEIPENSVEVEVGVGPDETLDELISTAEEFVDPIEEPLEDRPIIEEEEVSEEAQAPKKRGRPKKNSGNAA